MRKFVQAVIASIAFVAAASVHAQTAMPPPTVAVPQAVYVEHFDAVQVGTDSTGLLSRLRAAAHARSANRRAGLVAQAVVQRLNSVGVPARYLAPGEPPPASGWLIGGILYSRDVQGRLLAPPASGTNGDAAEAAAANTEVSVILTDLALRPEVPFAVIGAQDAIHGQGTVASWNPYIVAAKLVFKQAEANVAAEVLAQDIVDQIVGNLNALRQADAQTQQ